MRRCGETSRSIAALAPATVVTDAQAAALRQGASDDLKRITAFAGRHLQHANAALQALRAGPLRLQQGIDALLQGSQHRLQQAGLHIGQQLLHGQQRMQFRGVEPEPRQLVHGALGLVIAIAVEISVVDDGGIQVQAHVVDNALDGGAGAFQLFLQTPARDRLPRSLQDAVELENAVEAVHLGASRRCSSLP